jgi:AcrR family transcriptional regulator
VSKEDLIVRTAIKILETQNYHSMTTSVLAEEAGIAEGTIYCYFKNKKELFIRVLQNISVQLSELFVRDISKDNSMRENLRIIGKNFMLMDKESNALYKIIYKAFSEVEDNDIKNELGRTYAKGLEIVRQIILWGNKNEKPLPDSLPETIFMMLWGIGDMFWKRLVIDYSMSFETARLDSIIDFVCTWLENELNK